MGHGQHFVARVDAPQLAQRAQQALAGATVELQLLLVMLRARQHLGHA